MARVSDIELERLKKEVSVQRLAEARGVELKRHGADLIGRCPFHDDKTPSLVVTPSKNLWHCLGACQAGGSVIDWVMKAEGVSFRHAIELLRADLPVATSARVGIGRNGAEPAKSSTVRRLAAPVAFDAEDGVLLRQVVDYYHATLKQSPEALAYLEKRGLKSSAMVDRFRLGFSNRTLGLRLPQKNRDAGAAIRARLQKLGVMRESGHEHFAGSLVIPILDADDNVKGLYGRKVTPNLRPGTPLHLYLPGPHRGVFNEASLARKDTVILCESLIDALTFWHVGFPNVTSAYGVEGFTDECLAVLKRSGAARVLIAYDRDDAGEKAAEALAPRLQAEGLECYRVQFPRGMDANEYALKVQPAEKGFALAVRHAVWMGKGQGTPLPAHVAELAWASRPPPPLPLAAPSAPRPAMPQRVLEATAAKTPVISPKAMAILEQMGPDAVTAAQLGVASAVVAQVLASRRETPQRAELAVAAAATAPRPCAAEPRRAPTAPLATVRVSTVEVPAVAATSSPVARVMSAATISLTATAAAPPATSMAPPQQPTEPAAPRVADMPAEVKDDEVVVTLGERRYRVRGLSRNTSFDSLKVNLLVSKGDVFHVDTLDMYSARQRAAYVKQAAEELRLGEDLLKHDLGQLLLKLEELHEAGVRKALEPKKKQVTLSDAERDAALELLKSPQLLDRILADFQRCGVVGEETNKLVGYLAAVSRKLEEPLAVIIQSSTAAGKTALMEAVLSLVPDEDRVKYSAMTGQSLFYMGDVDLKHKVLAIVEEEGASRASYALKLLQSEGELTIASTGKDPATGRLVTHEYRVEGPVQLFLTTTAIELDEELLNRCVVLTVDEDREQTRAIHRLQRERQTLEGLLARKERDSVLKLHRDAQRLLRPLLVANPYARELTFLDDRTRTRRDFVKYLTLIRAVALLHQYQRPVKTVQHEGQPVQYLEVTREDLVVANRLANQVLGRSLDELPPQTRRMLSLLDGRVREVCQAEKLDRRDFRFSRKDVRGWTSWTDFQVRTHLEKLTALEYLVVHRGARGQSFVYELLYDGRGQDGRPFLMGLVDVEKLGQQYDLKFEPSKAEFEGGSSPQSAPIEPSLRVAELGGNESSGADLGASVATAAENAHLDGAAKSPSYSHVAPVGGVAAAVVAAEAVA